MSRAIDRHRQLRAEILAASGEGGPDYAFEAIGLPTTIELALGLLPPGGTGVLVGMMGYEWGWALPVGYALGVLAVTPFVGSGLPLSAFVRVPVALATMHLSWGWGFLSSPNNLRDRDLDGGR